MTRSAVTRPLAMLAPAASLVAPVLAAVIAGAAVHEGLHSAVPARDARLDTAPTELRLTFTGPVDARLARIGLQGPAGTVTLGEPAQPADSARLLVAAIEGPLVAGEHRVTWRIIGSDGHPVDGDFGFSILDGATGLAAERSQPPAGAADPTPAGPADPGSDPDPAPDPRPGEGDTEGFDTRSTGYVIIRWLGYLALLPLIGAVAFRWAVLPLAARRVAAPIPAALERAAARAGLVAAAVLGVAAIARLTAQAFAVAGPGRTPDLDLAGMLLTGTLWGTGWMLQAGGVVLALVALGMAARGKAAGWWLAVPAALALALAPALSGHAAAAGGWTIAADALHVIAAGGWIGGLLIVLVAALPLARAGDGPGLADLVAAFSVTALAFAGLLVMTGVAAALQHLPDWGALVDSEYGRALLLKVGLLIPLFAAGAYNYRRVRPGLATGDGAPTLRRTGGGELAVAVLVLLATAVLVATPPPAGQDPGAGMVQTP